MFYLALKKVLQLQVEVYLIILLMRKMKRELNRMVKPKREFIFM